MAQTLHHTSLDLLIHPGETISEILEDREITQKEFVELVDRVDIDVLVQQRNSLGLIF